jgi:hypothetical protein
MAPSERSMVAILCVPCETLAFSAVKGYYVQPRKLYLSNWTSSTENAASKRSGGGFHRRTHAA